MNTSEPIFLERYGLTSIAGTKRSFSGGLSPRSLIFAGAYRQHV